MLVPFLYKPRKYIWRDEFLSDGLIQQPGPGGRTLVNTETCMAIIPRVGTAIDDHTGVTFGGSNNRCSYDATGALTAWADFPTGFDMAAYADQGLMLVMFDSAGVGAFTFLGAAGSGETLGSEKLTNSSFDVNINSWAPTRSTVASVAGGQSNNCCELTATTPDAGFQQIIQDPVYGFTIGALYVKSCYFKSGTSLNEAYQFGNFNGVWVFASGTTTNSWVQNITHFNSISTSTAIALKKMSATLGTMLFDEASTKQVLTPSATGCYAYRDSALSVSGWNKPTAFNMNSASYTFGIYEPQSRGRMFFMGGKATPAYGDPGYWKTESITRKRGLVCAWKVSQTANAMIVGFDDNKSGSGKLFYSFNSTNIYPFISAVTGPCIALKDSTNSVTFVLVLRDSGCHFYAKIGTSNWKYLWSTVLDNTGTFYPTISNYNGVGYCDWIRQSNYLWMQKPLVSDSFAGADGSADGRVSNGLGHAEVSGLGSGGSGVVWSGATGSIVSNRLVITPELGEELLTNGNFAAWTGDNPDGWTLNIAENATNYVTEDSGKLRLVSDGTLFGPAQTVASLNSFYNATVDVISISGLLSLGFNGAFINSTGSKVIAGKATTAQVVIKRLSGAIDTTIDNVTFKQITLSTCFQTCTLPTKDVTLATRFTMVAGTQCGIVFGINGDNLGLLYHNGSGSVVLEIKESTTWTQKSIKTIAAVSDGELILRRDDNVIWAYYNNTLLDALTPTTTLSAGENSNLSGLTVGLFSTYGGSIDMFHDPDFADSDFTSTTTGNTFSKFTALHSGSNGEYSILERLIGN